MDWYELLKKSLTNYSHKITFKDDTKQVFMRGKELRFPEVVFNNLIYADEGELSYIGLIVANISISLDV